MRRPSMNMRRNFSNEESFKRESLCLNPPNPSVRVR